MGPQQICDMHLSRSVTVRSHLTYLLWSPILSFSNVPVTLLGMFFLSRNFFLSTNFYVTPHPTFLRTDLKSTSSMKPSPISPAHVHLSFLCSCIWHQNHSSSSLCNLTCISLDSIFQINCKSTEREWGRFPCSLCILVFTLYLVWYTLLITEAQ